MQRRMIVATVVMAFAASAAMAQDGASGGKSKRAGNSESKQPASGGGWPPCVGMLWDGMQCRHPRTGKICTVKVDTGGGSVSLQSCS